MKRAKPMRRTAIKRTVISRRLRKRLRAVSEKTRTERWPVLKANGEKIRVIQAGRCAYCHKAGTLEIHHVVKRSQTRDDSLANLVGLCAGLQGCHAWTDEPFSGRRGRLVIRRTEFFRCFSYRQVCAKDKWAARA